jgi:hypothetical protein
MAPLIDGYLSVEPLLRLLVLRERGRPRRTIVWLSTDRPHQPPAATPQKMLTVMADNELAAATYPVDLAAPVPLHELSERVRSRRVAHASWWPGGVTMWAGLAPRKGFTRPAPSRGDLPIPPICQRSAPQERHVVGG